MSPSDFLLFKMPPLHPNPNLVTNIQPLSYFGIQGAFPRQAGRKFGRLSPKNRNMENGRNVERGHEGIRKEDGWRSWRDAPLHYFYQSNQPPGSDCDMVMGVWEICMLDLILAGACAMRDVILRRERKNKLRKSECYAVFRHLVRGINISDVLFVD